MVSLRQLAMIRGWGVENSMHCILNMLLQEHVARCSCDAHSAIGDVECHTDGSGAISHSGYCRTRTGVPGSSTDQE